LPAGGGEPDHVGERGVRHAFAPRAIDGARARGDRPLPPAPRAPLFLGPWGPRGRRAQPPGGWLALRTRASGDRAPPRGGRAAPTPAAVDGQTPPFAFVKWDR